MRARTVALAVLVVALSVLAAPAAAATGGYPYAHYDGPGSDPAGYTWTDPSGNWESPYGYAYRNCTDYVAWRLATTNGFQDYLGLGNASGWAAAARARGYRVDHTPARGAVAWWGGELFGGFGHVAWVAAAYRGSVEVFEYNHHGTGRFDRRRIPTGAPDAYIHFRDLAARPRDGQFLAVPGGRAFRLVGGAPLPVTGWSGFGGRHPVLLVGRRVFARLARLPADGTYLTAAGHPYVVAGGAPIAIGSRRRVGGLRRATRIDPAVLAHAGGRGLWRHLRRFPADGTILRAGPGGHLYRVRDGAPVPIRSRSAGERAVVVDPAAIRNAGRPGRWRFLRRAPGA